MKNKNLTAAFKALRKLGYFTHKNFWCCSSCAWSALTEAQREKAVFYHGQDNDDLKEKGTCYLSWSGDGDEIVKVLNENDIKTEWDGKSDTRIKIDIN